MRGQRRRLRNERRSPSAAPQRQRMRFEVLEDRRVLAALYLDAGIYDGDGNTATVAQPLDIIAAVSPDINPSSSAAMPPDIGASLGGEEAAAITIPRGRPTLNATETTFVADNGNLLRGPFASTEWGNPPPLSNIQSIKNLGANAIHLYGEVFDPDYVSGVPGSGTAPGYSASRIDQMVQMTRDEGLYLVLTIGNGGNNGDFNRDYVMDFWTFYAARYKDETHVLFEIQNEPHDWSAPYPQAALDMEADAYTLIRSIAPDTPILLFSFAVLGSGSAAVADIAEVSAAASIDWTNAAVAFHGYAGHQATATSVEYILNAGYPVFMTEFGGSDWGTTEHGLDVELTAQLERLNVSWLTFNHIPPNFIGASYTNPAAVYDRVNNAGLSWEPDFGTWPALRGVYGNSGQPRQTTGLSGTLRIEAEYFDTGAQGVAYGDADGGNQGGQLRLDDGVDIELTADIGGGHDVGWTVDGEWLEYTIFVREAGFHNLNLRVASTTGGAVRAILNGADKTGEWVLPTTGGTQTWTTTTRQVFLEYGQQTLRLEIPTGGFNLNWIEISPISSGSIANGAYKFLNRNSALTLESDTANNRVVQNVYTGASNERWNLVHRGAGQYSITSVANGWSWSTFYDSNEEPLTLAGWGYDGAADRRFILAPTDNGYFRILVADGGLSIEMDGVSTSSGSIAQQYEYGGLSHQQWAVLTPAAPSFPTGLAATWGESGEIPGDYSSDGAVDGRDFLSWQRSFGNMVAPYSGADGDGSGVVDAGDRQVWAIHYGHMLDSSLVQLSWNAVPGATSYNIKRAATAGGPFETIASGVTATTYSDTGLVSGTSYYYAVSAVSSGGESLNSSEASPPLLHAHLKFDQSSGTSVIDTTGNGWGGTLVNGPLWAAGISGNAVDLDGTNDYVSLPAGVVNGLTAVTIATWVRLDAISNWARLFDFGTGTTTNMFLAPRSGSTSRPVFAITTSGAGGEQRINSSSVTIAANTWTHIAVTIGGGTGIMYIDGVEVGRNSEMSLTPTSLGATTQNYIGRSQYTQDPYLNGRVDDFRIYDEALSAADVAELAAVPLAATIAVLEVTEELTPAALRSGEEFLVASDANDAAFRHDSPDDRTLTSAESVVEREINWWEIGDNIARRPTPKGQYLGHEHRVVVGSIIFGMKNRNHHVAAEHGLVDLAFADLDCDWAMMGGGE